MEGIGLFWLPRLSATTLTFLERVSYICLNCSLKTRTDFEAKEEGFLMIIDNRLIAFRLVRKRLL